MKRRLVRIARGLGLALVALFVLYLVAANLLLSGGRLARLLSAKPETFRLRYDRASTLWLGRVHVQGLDVRVRDATLELELHVDDADASISLFALLGHRLRVSRVDATGVSWRLRFRREDGELSADKASLLPPIDGFPARPINDVPPLPSSDSKGHPFAIDMDDVTLHALREVWIDAFRLSGDFTVTGGFVLAPHDRVEVRPAHVDVHDATLATGPDVLVSGVHGAIDARIESTPLEGMGGAELVRHLSTRSSLEGRAGGIAFLRHFLPDDLVPSGGAGTFRGALTVDHGVVTQESASHASLERATLEVPGYAIGAASTIDLSVAAEDGGPAAKASIALRDVTLAARGGAPGVTSPAIALGARVGTTDLAVTPRDFTYSWDAPATTVADLRYVDAVLGAERDFRVVGGAGTVSTRGDGSLRGLDAHVKSDTNAAFTLEEAHLTSRVVVDAPVKVAFDARTVDLTGTTVDLAELAVRGGAPHPGWTGHARLDAAVLHATPPQVDLTFATRARDARPFLAFYAAMKDVSPATRLALSIVPDPAIEVATANLVGNGQVHVTPGVVAIRGLDVRGASTRVRGEWTQRHQTKNGGLLFEAGPITMGLAFEGETTRAVVVDAASWFATQAPASAR